MPVYAGVDFHARTQTVCWCDTSDGVIRERRLEHGRDDVAAFYQQWPAPAVIGIEASGYAQWFHQMLDHLGHQVLVGDAFRIRQFAQRRQKNDRRDAALLLDLLLHGDFPAIHRPTAASQQVLALLHYRHRLVRVRTALRNGVQAVALNHQLRLGPRLFTARGQQQWQALPLSGADAWQREHSRALLELLQSQIQQIEQQLEQSAVSDPRVVRLRTHPGVGRLTALMVVHTLEPAIRFDRARRIAAFCGLDPQEYSSGDRRHYGTISKQGNRLLRFLLIEAAHCAVQPGQDEQLRQFYLRIKGKRKPDAVAIVAVARKLVLRLYRMLREQIDYTEFRRRGRDAWRAREAQKPIGA